MSDVVRKYYDRTAEIEWDRLERDPYNMLEYVVTMHYLEKHLPSEGLILDAVVCLGPLSHLIDRGDREDAVRELVRVAKRGAVVLKSVIGLYGVFRVVLNRIPDEFLDPAHEERFTEGIHRVGWHEDAESEFTEAYTAYTGKDRGWDTKILCRIHRAE